MATTRSLKTWNTRFAFRKVFASLTIFLFLVSSNLTTAALANEQGGRRAAFEQFQIENPGLEKKELHQMFKQEWREIKGAGNGIGGGGHENVSNIQNQAIQNINNNNHVDRSDFATKADWQAAKQALKLEQKNLSHTLNQTIQGTVNNKTININHGFSLDLTSAVESITLGDKLFQGQSVVINVGGEDKTVSAGSKVTAAEYVAARQALSGGAQTVTLDAQGRATGGEIDLSAMTSGNQTMKVKDLTVPVAVTASGDFGKGGDVRILGDLTNSGSINAYASGNNSVNAFIKANSIINNEGASVTSTVSDLTLQAEKNFANFGDINATGNLTIAAGKSLTNSGSISSQANLNVLAPKVINTGSLASIGANVTFDTPVVRELMVNNIDGTIQSLNGAINVRRANYAAAFDSTVVGGDLLSKQLNLYSGEGSADINVNELTGSVNSSGAAVHVRANTETLQIGNQCLTGDPTFFNTGNIDIVGGSIVVGEDLAIIAQGNITTSASSLEIKAQTVNQGFDLAIIAGANITAGAGELPPSGNGVLVNGSTPAATAPVTIDGASATGGNIDFSSVSGILTISSSSQGNNLDGGNITLAAFADGSGNNGRVLLTSTSTIRAEGHGTGNNGNVTIVAGGAPNSAANTIVLGAIHTRNGTGTAVGTGNVSIATLQPTTDDGMPITFGTNGSITSGNQLGAFSTGAIPVNAGVSLGGPIDSSLSNGNIVIRAGSVVLSSVFANKVAVHAARDITLSTNTIVGGGGVMMVAGRNITTSAPIFNINSSAATGNAGNISIVAGANAQYTASGIVINGASTTGGRIDLAAGIDARAYSLGSVGGTINLIAYTGSDNTGNVQVTGDLQTSGVAVNGDINVVAGKTSGNGITLGVITSGAGATAGGDVNLVTAAPNAGITLSSGANFAGASSTFVPAAGQVAGAIVTGDIYAPSADVLVRTNSNASIGNIAVRGPNLAGSITIRTNGTSAFNINGSGPNRSGTLDTSGPSVGSAGSISITNIGNTGINVGSLGTGASNGSGGLLSLDADNGTLAITGGSILSAGGLGPGNSGGLLSLRGASITSSGSVVLTASGIGGATGGTLIVETTGSGVSGNINIGSGNGQLQVSASGGGGTIDLRSGGTITVGNSAISADNVSLRSNLTSGSGLVLNNSVTGSTSVSLQTAGSATMSGSGTVSGGLLNITASTGSTAINTNVTSVTLSTNGNVSLNEANGLTLNAGTTGAGNLSITSSALALSSGVSFQLGGDANLITNTLSLNGGTIQSTNGVISVTPISGGLTVNGGSGGVLTSSKYAPGAPGVPNLPGVILNSNTGDLTIAGVVTLSPDSVFNIGSNDLVISNTANWNSASNITVNADNILYQGNGRITANLLIFNTITPAGTIINTSGNVVLTSDLIFNGADLAIIASGNITASGITSIQLNNSTGSGGTLHLVAGFNATPSSGGQVQTYAPYTITTAGTGNVSLGSVSINTSATGATGNAGDVVAVASNGTISLGTITAMSNSGSGGDVLVVGQNGVNVGAIDVSGLSSGDVTLSASAPLIAGGPIKFTSGTASGGTFVASTTGTDAGMSVISPTVFFNGITGADEVTLRSGSHLIWQLSGTLAVNTLNIFSGVGGANLFSTSIGILNSSAAGTVTIGGEVDSIILGTITGANQSLNVSAAGNISTSSDFSIDSLFLFGSGASSSIDLQNNVQGATKVQFVGAAAITQSNGTKISGGELIVQEYVGTSTLATNVDSLRMIGASSLGSTLIINEDNGISLRGTGVELRVNTLGAGDITTAGTLGAQTVVLNTATGGGNIVLNHNVGGDIELRTANGGSIIQNAGKISGGTLTVINPGGSSTLATNVTNLNVQSVSNLVVNEDNGIAISANTGGGSLTVNSGVAAAGVLSTNGMVDVGAGNLILNAQRVGSSIQLNHSLISTGSVNLLAQNTITQTVGTKISATNLQVGYGGTSAVALATNVNSVNAMNAVGALTINEDDGITVSASGTTSDLTVNSSLLSGGSLITDGAISLTNIRLNAQGSGGIIISDDISGSNLISLASATSILQSGTISGGDLTVSFSSAGPTTLTTDVASITTTNASQSLTVNEANDIEVRGQSVSSLFLTAGGSITTGAAISVTGTLFLEAVGATSDVILSNNINGTSAVTLRAGRTITQTGGTKITGGDLSVNFGSGPVALTTAVGSVASSATGQSLTINEDDGIIVRALNLNSVTINAGLVSSGTLSTGQAISVAGNLIFDMGSGGDIHLFNDVHGGSGITLDAATITQNTGIALSGGGLTATANTIDLGGGTTMNFDGDVSLFTNNLNLHGSTIQTSAGIITVTSNSGDLTVDGGSGASLISTKYPAGGPGTPNASGVILSALGNGNLILEGNLNIERDATFNAEDNTVVIDTDAVITGVNNITVNATYLQKDGTLNANIVIFTPTAVGAIINTTGDLVLTSDFIISGANFALLSSGNINAQNINIDWNNADGGTFTMIAGYNASPNSGGQLETNSPYTLTSAGIGSVNMSGTTITTSAANAGSVVAIASNGSVNIGAINAVSSVGTGGNVTLIGETGVTVGAIDASGAANGGNILLSASTPTLVGAGPVVVENGALNGGAFAAGTLRNASITFGNIVAGTGSFATETSSSGAITATSGISAHDIRLETGVLALSTISTLTSNLDNSDNAGQIDITANSVTTADIADRLVLSANGIVDGGVINFTLNSTSATSVGNAGTYEFQFEGGASGNGGRATLNTQGNVTLSTYAFVGTSGGNGGAAYVNTDGSITVGAGAFDLAGGTDGATISLDAGGVVNLSSGIGFFTQANAVGPNSNGGCLILRGSTFVFPAGVGSTVDNALNLTATANGTGNNGTIVFESNSTTAMQVGTPTGKAPKGPQFFVTANASGGGGDAGSITLATGGNLTVNSLIALNASSSFTAGSDLDGASYSLTAGRNGAAGSLIVNGALNGSALGNGDGGDITLSARSNQAFVVNATKAPTNGTFGAVRTDNGGGVTISNLNGGVTLANAISVIADDQRYNLGGKGAFAAKGFTVNAIDNLSINSTGSSTLSNLSVNTSNLSVTTVGGTVAVTNMFNGSWNLENATGKSLTITTGSTGSVTLNDMQASAGNILVVNNSGNLVVANDANIRATNGALTLQNTNLSGQIQVGTDAVVETFGTKGKNATLTVSTAIPKNGTNPTTTSVGNINVAVQGKGVVFLGTTGAVVAASPVNVNALNKNVIFNGPVGSIVLGAGSTVTADPPPSSVAASASVVGASVIGSPAVAAALPAQSAESASGLFGFVAENALVTSDLRVLNLNAASESRSSVLYALNRSAGGSPTAGGMNAAPTMGTREDNSYMVGFMGNSFGESEAALCSDVELGVGRSAGFQPASENAVGTIQTVQHSERVVIKKGNVLFVPFKATTVETPNGIVHIDAKAVALVSSTDAGLAVYDLEDQHKGSVSVESNGHNVVLAPGRHVMITKHHTAEFAQINAVETIAHRNVQSVVKNGHRAHTSEFSVLTAMDTVKPLKALASSKHAHARQIADRMMKTTAIILQLGGGSGGQYQHYFKPRMTAKM